MMTKPNRSPLQTHLWAQGRVFAWLFLAMLLFVLFRPKTDLPDSNQPLEERLAAFLGAQTHMTVASADIAMPLTSMNGFASLGLHPVFFLAMKEKEPRDLYLAWIRIAPNGTPLALSANDIYNLSRTDKADEGPLTLRGSYLAVASRSNGQITVVTVYDLKGKKPPGDEFSWLEKRMEAISNFQETGQTKGFERKTLTFTQTFRIQLRLGERPYP